MATGREMISRSVISLARKAWSGAWRDRSAHLVHFFIKGREFSLDLITPWIAWCSRSSAGVRLRTECITTAISQSCCNRHPRSHALLLKLRISPIDDRPSYASRTRRMSALGRERSFPLGRVCKLHNRHKKWDWFPNRYPRTSRCLARSQICAVLRLRKTR